MEFNTQEQGMSLPPQALAAIIGLILFIGIGIIIGIITTLPEVKFGLF